MNGLLSPRLREPLARRGQACRSINDLNYQPFDRLRVNGF